MAYPTTGNLAPAFADLTDLAKEAAALTDRAGAILNGIRPALIGQRVIAYGRTYQICQVDMRGNARVTCYGVRVSKSGRVGTRGFDLGQLENCQFINEKGESV